MKINQLRITRLPVLAAVIAIVLIGSGLFFLNKGKTETANRESNESSVNTLEPIPADMLALERIRELAAAEAYSVDINSIDLEREDGVVLYKVKFVDGVILFFNAQTGDKVDRTAGQELDSDDTTNIPVNFSAGIGFDKAREIARTQKPDGTIRKIELEMEDGKLVYSVRFTDKARVDVNAADGVILRNDPAKGQSGTAPNNDGAGNSDSSSGRSSDSGIRGNSEDNRNDSSGSDN